MMQGITALPGAQQGPQAQQAPGQATPFQALPAVQPKTSGIAQTPALSQQSTDALLAMYRNPKLLEGTPYSLYGVIGALSEQLKAEAADEAAKNNAAMAAYGQQVQQPPVAEGLAQQAAMLARPTQMARHGGVMHGYAGGGAVAFENGGRVQKYTPGGAVEQPFYRRPAGAMPAPTPGETFFPATTGFEGMSLPEFFEALFGKAKESIGSEEENVERRNRERAAKALEERMGPLMRSYKGRPSMSEAEMQAAYEKAGLRATPPSVPAPAPAPAEQRASRHATGAPAPATQTSTGLGALIAEQFKRISSENPEIVRIGREAQKSAEDTAAMLQRMQGLSPEEAAARAQYYKTVEGAYEPQRKSLEAAQAATREGLLQSPEALARLASAFGGAKRVGQGLSAAAGAAGEVLGERRKRAEQLEERYQTLSSQLAITTAQAKRADVEGDEKRKRELMLQAQGLKDKQLATGLELLKTSQGMRAQDIAGIAALTGTQAQMMQAGKPTAQEFLYNLYRKDPKAFEGFLTAQQGPKSEAAERTAMLRALVTEAVKNPLMFQQLPPEMKAIVQQEMLKLGVTSALPSGANVRE